MSSGYFGWLFWLRFRFARVLDRLFPHSCWAELAAWAMGYDQPFRVRGTCHVDPPSVGCWCGKFRGEREEGKTDA